MNEQSPFGMLITFSGIDGSGKSTMARYVFDFLSKKSPGAVKYLWCKFGWHPLAILRLSRFFKGKRKPKRLPKNKLGLLYKLYGLLLIRLHLFWIYWNITRHLRRGFIVICDRYIYDTVVDLQQEFFYSEEYSMEIVKMKQLPQPEVSFYFDIPEEIAFHRKTDTLSVTFLNERRKFYQSLFAKINHIEINASDRLDIVCSSVMEVITNKIETGGK